MQLARAFALFAALLGADPAAAILVRPDRDDAEYLELATRYPASIALPSGGEGVLIAPRWVLTAAHRARALQEMKPPPKLALGGREHDIEAIHLHPDWKAGEANDIALVLLRKSVAGVEPAPIYRASDEYGKGVVIVGHGETGRIGAKSTASDGRKRAAINTVDRVQPRALGLRIKPAGEASDLQGAAAPGDSGAPAIIETKDGLFVAGIGHGTEGDWETYARVSAFASWIEALMLDVARKEADSLLDPERR